MQDFILAQREQIADLCCRHHVRRLSIFGSAARDDFDTATSDVDVIIEFDSNEIPIETYADNKSAFHEELAQYLQRKVDLLTWESVKILTCCKRYNNSIRTSMQRKPALYLWKIQEMCGFLLERAQTRSEADYLSDLGLRLAVERAFCYGHTSLT